MTNSRGRFNKGRLVPVEAAGETRVCSVSVRPLKLAFVINEGAAQEELVKYLSYNSTVWGGLYNPMVPTDGRTLREDWWQVLIDQAPDKIIVCGDVSAPLVEELHARAHPYGIHRWQDDAAGMHKSGVDGFGSIPLLYPLEHLYQESRPIAKSNVRLPQVEAGSPYRELAAAQFGLVPETYRRFYLEALEAEPVNLSGVDFAAYAAQLLDLDRRLTPVKAARHDLSSHASPSSMGAFTIVLAGERPLPDVCLFWNLRMHRPSVKGGAVILPLSELSKRENVLALAELCNASVVGSNFMVLASASVSRRRLSALAGRLRPLLDQRIEHVDVWFSDFVTGPVRAYDTEDIREIQFEGGEFRLKVPHPKFAERVGARGEWVVDVQPGEEDRRAAGFLPPVYLGLNSLLSGDPEPAFIQHYGYQVRFANERVSYRVSRQQEFISGKIPLDQEVFISLLRSKSYGVEPTDKNRYIRGLVDLVGGLGKLHILQQASLRDLLYEMNGGEAYSPREMMYWLRPKPDQVAQTHEMLAELARKKVFLRGYKIHCPVCDLTRWYAVTDVDETTACAGCLSRLQLPIEAPFSYRLNELVARGVSQGSVSVVLTVLFLKKLARDSFMYAPGLEVLKARKIDLDVAASCDGHLVLAECKDLRGGTSLRTVREVSAQLSEVVDIAKEVGAEAVFLAVLADAVPADLQRRVAGIAKRAGRAVTVQLLTGVELERGYKSVPLGAFLSPDDPLKPGPASLEDLLPKRQARERGWVKEKGTRSISF